jgi:hypothetical protein
MKTLLTILLIGYTTISFSQSNFLKDRKPDLEIGLNSTGKLNTVELGWNSIKDYGGAGLYGLFTDGIIIGSEFGMKNNNLVIAPKITYSYNYILLNGSFSIINYNIGNQSSLYLKPQIGFTFCGYIDMVYGYNIPLSNRKHEFQGSTLTLRCNIFKTSKYLFNK